MSTFKSEIVKLDFFIFLSLLNLDLCAKNVVTIKHYIIFLNYENNVFCKLQKHFELL